MTPKAGQSAWTRIHSSLLSNRETLAWQERQSLAASLIDELSAEEVTDGVLKLVELLANDPKWEVRKAVASLLSSLPNDHVVPIAAKLTDDSNGFVRNAAVRAMSMRRRGPGVTRKPQTGLEFVMEQSRILEGISGPNHVSKIRELALELYDISVGSVVHNLRGVLTSAKSKVALLQSELEQPSPDVIQIKEGAKKLADRLNYLEQITESMSRYSRGVQSQKMELELNTLVDDAQQMALEAFESTHGNVDQIQFSESLQSGIRVRAARHEVVVAISNVIKNAYEAVLVDSNDGQSGAVHLKTESLDETVQVVVWDNGIGLSSVDLRELHSFVPGRTTKKGYGTGFGLPISQRYLEAHGGRISIESAEDVGTTVIMTIPVVYSEERADE